MAWKQSIASIWLVLLLSSSASYASHIVGGEISYCFVSYNADETEITLEVILKLFRDPTGAEYDRWANFGVFEQESWGAWKSYEVVRDVEIGPIVEVSLDQDPCKVRDLNEEKLEQATYTFRVTLEVGDNNYLIAYQKCCRNNTINNIIGGGIIGSVYDILITPEALKNGNSSPSSSAVPPIFICSDYPLDIDISEVDKDGDILVYSFCTPKFPSMDLGQPGCCGCISPDPAICIPPYPEVVYVPPYNADYPMPADPPLSLHGSTGQLIGQPTMSGSYVTAICTQEYRNGVLLTETRRDYEFNVINCSEKLVAKISSDNYLPATTANAQDSIAYFQSCNDLDFSIINESQDPAHIQDYRWQIEDKDGEIVFDVSGPTFRDVDISLLESGTYTGSMILSDGGICADTAYMEIFVIPAMEPMISIDFDTCVAGPVSFMGSSDYDLTEVNWTWDLGDENVETLMSFEHTYDERDSYQVGLNVEDDYGCVESISTTLDWNPYELVPPDTIYLTELLCHGDSVFIYDSWILEAGTYYDYLPSQFTGCDSIVEEILVAFMPEVEQTDITASICEGEIYTFQDIYLLDKEGTYDSTLSNKDGCDSIIVLTLTVHPTTYGFESIGICENETITWEGQNISMAGTLVATLENNKGCDSIAELTVIEIQEKETAIEDGFCAGDVYSYDGQILSESGIYEFSFLTSAGCDSTVTLSLQEFPIYDLQEETEICEGGYYLFNGEEISTEGSHLAELQTINGCDSMITLFLDVLPSSEYEYLDTICLGEVYAFGEIDLRLPGIYFRTITNSNGCDSLIILDLEVGQNLSRINVDEAIEMEYGSSIILEPEINGGDLISSEWSEVDRVLSNALVLDYLVQDDGWVYFESMNELFCVALDSIFIRSFLDLEIYFPNIISPDGDGINDVFNIGGTDAVHQSQLTIYDRWGNKMYTGPMTDAKDMENGWDGTYNGMEVAVGTYAYVVLVEYINGELRTYSGDLTVVR